MSKITFRADDDLVEAIESFDASKSEVMREALRAYLQHTSPRGRSRTGRSGSSSTRSIDELVDERIDARVDERIEERLDRTGNDVDVSISLEGLEGIVRADTEADAADAADGASRKTPSADGDDGGSDGAPAGRCGGCGRSLEDDHVYCPNCGEQASRRVYCDCGEEVRSDWSFCPGCGRRTPVADVLEPGDRRG